MKILITGGAGFIGRHLTCALQKRGHWVRWLDSLDAQIHGPEAATDPDYCRQADEMILGDVRRRRDWQRALRGVDVIIHLAAQTGTGQSMYRIAYYNDVNVGGTALLWDILANERNSVKRVLIASSRAVYGEGAYRCQGVCGTVVPEPRSKTQLDKKNWEVCCPLCGGLVQPIATSEASIPRPASMYSCTKLAQEQMSLTMGKALCIPTIACRFQNVFGPGQSLRNPYTGIISIFSNQLRQNLPINVYEDGNESRDFVFVEDVAEICAQAMEWDCESAVVNGGSGHQTRMIDLANDLHRLWNSTSKISITGDFRVGDIRHNWADMTQLLRLYPNWHPMNLKQGLKKYVYWAQGQAVYMDQTRRAKEELKKRNL